MSVCVRVCVLLKCTVISHSWRDVFVHNHKLHFITFIFSCKLSKANRPMYVHIYIYTSHYVLVHCLRSCSFFGISLLFFHLIAVTHDICANTHTYACSIWFRLTSQGIQSSSITLRTDDSFIPTPSLPPSILLPLPRLAKFNPPGTMKAPSLISITFTHAHTHLQHVHTAELPVRFAKALQGRQPRQNKKRNAKQTNQIRNKSTLKYASRMDF